MNKRKNWNFQLYIGGLLVLAFVVLAVIGPSVAPHEPDDQVKLHSEIVGGKSVLIAPPIEPFTMDSYLLGTGLLGFDLLTKLLYGARYTLVLSLAIALLKMVFGALIGLYTASMKRQPGWIGALENAWSYIPVFIIVYFCLFPINFFGYQQFSSETIPVSFLIGMFIVITAVVGIPSVVSSVRQKTLKIKDSEYVTAAFTLGAGKHRFVWKHVFPQMKEDLVVMFVLEIVYAMTVMGQLALFHIFVGGTIVYDLDIWPAPQYLSVTNEWAGLVGAGRDNIFGYHWMLKFPLFALLFATVSFSLFANGLKNRVKDQYQRTPWM
ncbi:MAG TPA: ABC transporter permease subunit [Bacillales bacterium]|nr:ABC transporter permease subunit [Bacillales bacterium]